MSGSCLSEIPALSRDAYILHTGKFKCPYEFISSTILNTNTRISRHTFSCYVPNEVPFRVYAPKPSAMQFVRPVILHGLALVYLLRVRCIYYQYTLALHHEMKIYCLSWVRSERRQV